MKLRFLILALAIVAYAALGATTGGAHDRTPLAHASSVSAPRIQLSPCLAPRRTPSSLLAPYCACDRHPLLEELSMGNGRRIRVLGRLDGAHGQVSPLAPIADGTFDVTFESEALCRDVWGDIYFVPGCTPRPNTCTSVVDWVDPATGSVATVYTAPEDRDVSGGFPSPNGDQLALVGGPCEPASGRIDITVRNLLTGRQWTLGRSVRRCTGIGPTVAWSSNGKELLFPWARISGAPGPYPQWCSNDQLARLVVTAADRNSGPRSWSVIRADNGCSFLHAVFDARGIAAIEGCYWDAYPTGNDVAAQRWPAVERPAPQGRRAATACDRVLGGRPAKTQSQATS